MVFALAVFVQLLAEVCLIFVVLCLCPSSQLDLQCVHWILESYDWRATIFFFITAFLSVGQCIHKSCRPMSIVGVMCLSEMFCWVIFLLLFLLFQLFCFVRFSILIFSSFIYLILLVIINILCSFLLLPKLFKIRSIPSNFVRRY